MAAPLRPIGAALMSRLVHQLAVLAGLVAALLIALYGAPVAAQGTCGLHAAMTMKLKAQYGETRRGVGLIGPAAIVELWASDEPPYTWTILEVYTNGRACLKVAGTGWHPDAPAIPGEPI